MSQPEPAGREQHSTPLGSSRRLYADPVRVFVSSPKQKWHIGSESELLTQGAVDEWYIEIAEGGQLHPLGQSLREADPGEKRQMF